MIGLKYRSRSFALLVLAIFATFLFTLITPAAHAQSSVIMMTTEKTEIALYLAGSGQATIDWGMGTAQTVTLDSGRINHWAQKTTFTAPGNLPAGTKTIRVTAVNGSIAGLSCDGLTSLDVRGCPALTYLDCSHNSLTSLDLRANTALTSLNCYGNSLTSLDLRANTALETLFCGANGITSIDLRANTVLSYLDLDPGNLTSLDLRANTALKTLLCDNNKLNTDALNALFATLPRGSSTRNSIVCGGNPGSSSCDKSIASAKG